MTCYHPIEAWYSAEKNPSGKRNVVFQAAGAHGLPFKVPCGQCIGCRLDRAHEWAVRCMHEAQFHETSSFLTLTYGAESLPADGSLDVRHLQLFCKRLRASLAPERVRFFACGEYGDRNRRPHYHMLLFGHAFLSDRKRYTETKHGTLYTSERLTQLWGLGECWIGSLTFQSAAYVARYSLKKVNGDRADAHYSVIDKGTGEINRLGPEFLVMSRNPGIGRPWLDKFQADIHPDDFVIVNGRKTPVPRYYTKQLASSAQADIKKSRKEKASKNWRNNTSTRLAVREEVKKASISHLKRDIP